MLFVIIKEQKGKKSPAAASAKSPNPIEKKPGGTEPSPQSRLGQPSQSPPAKRRGASRVSDGVRRRKGGRLAVAGAAADAAHRHPSPRPRRCVRLLRRDLGAQRGLGPRGPGPPRRRRGWGPPGLSRELRRPRLRMAFPPRTHRPHPVRPARGGRGYGIRTTR